MTVGDLVEPVFHVTLEVVRAWTSSTKVKLTSIDPEMMSMITAEVIGRLGARYVTQSWVSPETTPEVVRKLICMRYVGWYYLRQFAEADTENDYGVRLLLEADSLLNDILDGSIILVEEGVETIAMTGLSFEPLESDPSFTMDKVW